MCGQPITYTITYKRIFPTTDLNQPQKDLSEPSDHTRLYFQTHNNTFFVKRKHRTVNMYFKEKKKCDAHMAGN